MAGISAARFCLPAAVPLIFLLLCHPLLSSCAHTPAEIVEIEAGAYPFFIDEGPPQALLTAIDRHISYLNERPQEHQLLPSVSATNRELVQSLTAFRSILSRSPDPVELNRLIRDHFSIFQSTGRNAAKEMLVTGYYEPIFNGSLTRTERYRFPLYGVPDSLVQQQDPAKVGRVDESGSLVPYWTRAEIESADLLQGGELAYLQNRLDAYLLQVQGSGRIRLPDGQVRSLHYAASNGHQYNSLGKLLVDQGVMPRSAVSIESIRAYFDDHPESLEPMLFHNPRYIFFDWGDDRGPRGSIGQVLTAQRSIALDHDIFPTGAIGYLVSRHPVLDEDGAINHWKVFGRFVLPQDSGAAIKGAGRVDLFMGSDYYAEKAAGHMNETGSLFFLLPASPVDTNH